MRFVDDFDLDGFIADDKTFYATMRQERRVWARIHGTLPALRAVVDWDLRRLGYGA